MPTTPNYNWIYPTDGGSSDAWGQILNDMAVAIDGTVQDVEDIATAALPKAGGIMTGRVDTLTSTATIVAKGTGSGAQVLDCSLGQAFTITLNGATVFTFSNPPAALFGFVLKMVGGSAGVSWPATVKWGAGAAPTLSAGTDILGFVTFDGGATWYGTAVCLAAA